MASLFWRQFWALFVKNWIVLSKHPWLNLLRCLILPIAYGVFLAVAQEFLNKPNNYGIGTPIPIFDLKNEFDGSLALVWADGTNGSTHPSPSEVISHVTSGFSPEQLRAVQRLDSPTDIPSACPPNFNLFSECFAAISFNSFPSNESSDAAPLNYTIHIDGGLFHIDVVRHKSDYELRVLPLQWAIDKALIELTTGATFPTPLEWPFTQETNEEQDLDIRLSYIRGLRSLLVLALFICYIGIAYQLPGSFASERANLLTAHMKAMGLLDSARILIFLAISSCRSWLVSICLAYAPAWTLVSIFWRYRIFSSTSTFLIFAIHFLFGVSLASYSLFLAIPFRSSPALAAVFSTFASIILAIIALVMKNASTGAATIFTLIFPPAFYIFASRAVAGFELHQVPTDILKSDPDHGLRLLPLIIIILVDIVLWPCLALLAERRLYDANRPSRSLLSRLLLSKSSERTLPNDEGYVPPSGTAISIRHLGKQFKGKGLITAVEDLSLDIPESGIYVLLGSNGAGKSTTMSILGGLLAQTQGSVKFFQTSSESATQADTWTDKPSRGTIGIVPQKNVLFPELSCYQTVRLWRAIKANSTSEEEEDIKQLLSDCDLGAKIHYNADKLSGGQKRKLQLAIGLVGGSRIVLVDECTSGVDPLSRRAIWKTLSSLRHSHTIVFTTHFLDEADLLADTIAILAAPGKLVAHGSPVHLKTSYGEGYMVDVKFSSLNDPISEKGAESDVVPADIPSDLLETIRGLIPSTYMHLSTSPHVTYHLKTRDSSAVKAVLELVEEERERPSSLISSYSVRGTSIEDVFLGLMQEESDKITEMLVQPGVKTKLVPNSLPNLPSSASLPHSPTTRSYTPSPPTAYGSVVASNGPLNLTSGRPRSPISQALTIFHKRILVARRSWLTPLLAVLVAVAGSCIPLFFISNRPQTCVKVFRKTYAVPLYLPFSPILLASDGDGEVESLPLSPLLVSPPGIVSPFTLGPTVSNINVANIPSNASFVDTIQQTYRNQSIGGISLDVSTGSALVTWEATPPGLTGPTILNLATNILYQRALNSTSGSHVAGEHLIAANLQTLPGISGQVLVSLKWVAFYGAAMAVYPAFFSLYVTKERRSSVQAMQLSNGLSNPVGMWLGHLFFDSIFGVVAATLMVIIFSATSNQFHGLGFMWVVLVLYGIVGALFSYCASLLVSSSLAAFAVSAGYQIVMFLLYTAGYLLTLTYAKTSLADRDLTIIHYTLSILSPVASAMRAAFVSVNLFSLLCDGTEPVTASSMGELSRFGGPILYLFVYAFILFFILVWVDSGSILPRRVPNPSSVGHNASTQDSDEGSRSNATEKNVMDEADSELSSTATLRVLDIVRSFGGKSNRVVDHVSFQVEKGTVFALLGPNGAGKTTTFKIIGGDVVPNQGDVIINGTSVVHHPRTTRLSLGVCPQFTAIDSQLTVREHLIIYGRLKGLRRGEELHENIERLLHATALHQYADRLASKLSGGNQRKLSLAIALIGNPSCILIDEFSTGIDARMKREMWKTLQNVSHGKAIVITTHSMEEASALATKVGILARRMLSIGTPDELATRYAVYEVHFACRTREEILRAQVLMSHIPGSQMADDVSARFEVPVGSGLSLSQLFSILSDGGSWTEYTVERVTLEGIFLKVIRENNVLEEDRANRQRRT